MKILSAVAAIIFFAVGAMAQTTNDLSDAEIQGRQLAQKLLEQIPVTNSIQTGVLKTRDNKGNSSSLRMLYEVQVAPDFWNVFYKVNLPTNSNWIDVLGVMHMNDFTNRYVIFRIETNNIFYELQVPIGTWLSKQEETMRPFCNSDFWICDLGLEFFHWPEQKILKKENRRSRACNVLESTNPNPSANGYSRVVSWIDEESGGIVHAEAYDAQNKLLKEFDPKSFKKVNGQWELQEMEIRNVQTGSRSRLEFDLKKE